MLIYIWMESYALIVPSKCLSDMNKTGPWNIFDDKDVKGEAGTLANAASPAANPDLIYAGGQNNGVSSGIIKTTDGAIICTFEFFL